MQFSNGQIGVRTAESWGTIPDARKEIINPEVPRSAVCRETQTDVNEAAFADRWKQKVLKTPLHFGSGSWLLGADLNRRPLGYAI